MENEELKKERRKILRGRKPKEEDKKTQPEIRDDARDKAQEQSAEPFAAKDSEKCKVKVWLKATIYI